MKGLSLPAGPIQLTVAKETTMPTSTIQSQTLLKTGQAVVRSINSCVKGSADGTLNDAATTGAAASTNAVAGYILF